ncbi:MAG: hypothetical protein SGBAC_000782 [Bacillariaceae sp.]
MRINKARERDSQISIRKRQAVRYVSITLLLFVLACLNSVQMMPLHYNHETLRLQDLPNQQSETDSVIGESSTRQQQIHSQSEVATSTSAITLRLDWTSQAPQSKLAKRMQQHQTNCSLPLGNFKFRNRFGLGSDLHVWSQAMCNAMQFGVRDHPIFDSALFNISGGRRQGTVTWDCPSILSEAAGDDTQSRLQFQEAGIELLFGQVSPHVVEEAKRQHFLVFRGSQTPSNLITVHIRWGDKNREMKLLSIQQYMNAIQQLIQERSRPTVNIFLATEDPEAVQQFQQQAPADWKIYVDQFYTELLPHRNEEYNGVPKAATALEGRMGTIALGSLLVALEANEFVITTESNWSRLLNELRKSIVDPSCHGCTKAMDLKPIKSI